MKALGLIAEYNPMHFGHTYHIRESQALKKPDVTIVVMSGSVVQRGDFAMHDKWVRTHTALHNGVDLVIELPSFYVLQSADYFAQASVDLLDRLHVSDLVFGSETGDLNPLKSLLALHQTSAFKAAVKAASAEGLSYPDAMVKATQNADLKLGLTPNNILGLGYLKALNALDSQINADTIKRTKRTYYAPLKKFQKIQSATAIRTAINSGQSAASYVPDPLSGVIDTAPTVQLADFYREFSYRLKMVDNAAFKQQFGFAEGLENRFLKAHHHATYFDFLEAVKTPRYTYAHINRAMMHFLLHTPAAFDAFDAPPYIRILGMTKTGQAYLNHVKKDLHLPVFTSAKHGQHPLLDFEIKISQLIATKTNQDFAQKELNPPIRV